MIVGVNDNGCLMDRDSGWIKKQKDIVESQIRNLLKPSATAQFISIEELDGKKCLFIEIINPGSPVSWNGKFYKRTGSQTSEMFPGEKRSLELERPGFDFSDFNYDGEIDSSLVLDFAKFLPIDNGDWTKLSSDEILSKLNIKNKNVSGILFGHFTFRLVHYNEDSEVLDQKEKKGLYQVLKEDFITHIQSWTRTKGITLKAKSLSVTEEEVYPNAVLREVLVNAVAHSAFEKSGSSLKIELYKDRIKISNRCSSEAESFIHKIFSKKHSSYNPFLMKILRMAKFSDELGTGKTRIFRTMIESGKREPLIEYEKKSNEYGTLSVTVYNEQPNKNFLKLLEKLKTRYSDNKDKYRVSAALVLWKDKSLMDILSYMDGYHRKLVFDILEDMSSSPFFISKRGDEFRILLKRWVCFQLEGQESKTLSQSEENNFKDYLQEYAYGNNRKGVITNKEARDILGLSNTQSEIVQISRLFGRWSEEGFMEKGGKRGYWKVKQEPDSPNSQFLKIQNLIEKLKENIKNK